MNTNLSHNITLENVPYRFIEELRVKIDLEACNIRMDIKTYELGDITAGWKVLPQEDMDKLISNNRHICEELKCYGIYAIAYQEAPLTDVFEDHILYIGESVGLYTQSGRTGIHERLTNSLKSFTCIDDGITKYNVTNNSTKFKDAIPQIQNDALAVGAVSNNDFDLRHIKIMYRPHEEIFKQSKRYSQDMESEILHTFSLLGKRKYLINTTNGYHSRHTNSK